MMSGAQAGAIPRLRQLHFSGGAGDQPCPALDSLMRPFPSRAVDCDTFCTQECRNSLRAHQVRNADGDEEGPLLAQHALICSAQSLLRSTSRSHASG